MRDPAPQGAAKLRGGGGGRPAAGDALPGRSRAGALAVAAAAGGGASVVQRRGAGGLTRPAQADPPDMFTADA